FSNSLILDKEIKYYLVPKVYRFHILYIDDKAFQRPRPSEAKREGSCQREEREFILNFPSAAEARRYSREEREARGERVS
ncbi:MAG: hypothetical protein Q4D33_12400, partial [Prevotellaceae bacterium]|nr:hypothetical protein [Prevotellaceae bacterium]